MRSSPPFGRARSFLVCNNVKQMRLQRDANEKRLTRLPCNVLPAPRQTTRDKTNRTKQDIIKQNKRNKQKQEPKGNIRVVKGSPCFVCFLYLPRLTRTVNFHCTTNLPKRTGYYKIHIRIPSPLLSCLQRSTANHTSPTTEVQEQVA